jgi:hypothetical protein
MAQYSDRDGGVGAPVGLTVFKTAGGSLGAVPGGFDSHTPLPRCCIGYLLCCLFTHRFWRFPKPMLPFSLSKTMLLIQTQRNFISNRITGFSLMLYSMDEVISRKKALKKQALSFNLMCPLLTRDVSHSDDPRIPSRKCTLVARGVGRH